MRKLQNIFLFVLIAELFKYETLYLHIRIFGSLSNILFHDVLSSSELSIYTII